jgi:HAMP domain-containing protein
VTGRAKAINPALNLGDPFTLNDYIQTIDQLRSKLDAHNSALAAIGSSQTEIEALEKTLNEMTERMLIEVAFKFGKDSREYEMAGGVRKSERVHKRVNTRLKAGAKSQSSEESVTA